MDEMSREIKLTQGKVAIIDNADYEWINQWKWCFNGYGYAVRNIREKGIHKLLFMHRVILNTPDGMFSDHVNHDTLDNRRCNLRIADKSQNGANRGMDYDNNSGVKGVDWVKRDKKWRARIMYHKKFISLGYYDAIEEASEAYKQGAKKYFGEYSYA